jgi:hypothetical protein
MALVAEYGFNEGTGTTAADTSGNGYHLTATGSPWAASGKNGAGSTPSASDYFTRANLGSGTLTAWTMMVWVKRTGATIDFRQLITSSGTNVFFELYGPGFHSRQTWGFDGAVIASTSLTLNTWTHLAVSYDGSTMTLYQDGVNVGSISTSGYSTSRANAWQFGHGPENPPLADLDEIRIFDTALTSTEISTWMGISPWFGTSVPPQTISSSRTPPLA